MARNTTDDHDNSPPAAPHNGTPQVPGVPAEKVHAPGLDQHGEAGEDTMPRDPPGHETEASTPEQGV